MLNYIFIKIKKCAHVHVDTSILDRWWFLVTFCHIYITPPVMCTSALGSISYMSLDVSSELYSLISGVWCLQNGNEWVRYDYWWHTQIHFWGYVDILSVSNASVSIICQWDTFWEKKSNKKGFWQDSGHGRATQCSNFSHLLVFQSILGALSDPLCKLIMKWKSRKVSWCHFSQGSTRKGHRVRIRPVPQKKKPVRVWKKY